MPSHTKTAAMLALGTAFISGVSVFVNKFGVAASGSPIVYTFAKNSIVGLLFISVLLAIAKRGELRTLTKVDWTRLLFIGGVGGSIPFMLFYMGLSQTTVASASFIHKSLFLWVALLAVPFLKERVGMLQGVALALLVVGNGFIGKVTTFGRGEWLILIATLMWAVETIVIKHTLRHVSSWTVAAARMGIGSLVLFVVVMAQGKLSILIGYSFSQWGWTALTAVFLFGYVATWTAALKRASAVLVSSLLVPAAFITSACSAIYSGKSLTPADWWSAAFFIAGVMLTALSHRIVIFYDTRRQHYHA